MGKKDKVTPRQEQVLRFIYNSLKNSGYPPTLADLREQLDVSSNQGVLDLLKLLEQKSFIKREEGTARGIKLNKKSFDILGVDPILPYVGITAAGLYTQIFEDVEWKSIGGVDITSDILVRVKGDSMIGAGINDGDIVVIRKAGEFKNGEIVLARDNDETTIKRLVHDNGRVYLKPENPKYKNVPIYPETRLIGKLVKILGKETKNNEQYNL